MDPAETDFISNNAINTADAKYAGALLLSHLRSIKNACAGADDSLVEGGHNWLAATAAGAGDTAIIADIVAAIDDDSLALLEAFAAARVAGPGVPTYEAGMRLA